MIKAHALTRTYQHTTAVQDVSFEITTQEVVALLGQNGAGKTTLMKMLTGYLEPTSGSVSIEDLDLATNREEVQRKIGYLPESSPLYLDMTVLEYLDYAASLRGVKESYKAARIKYALNKTSLVEVSASIINTLSKGYRQRIGVAQALLNSPSVLILDEPTSGLDPSQILEMRSLIKDLAKSATVLVSTHNLLEVQEFGTRVIILNKGRIVIDDRISDLRKTHSMEIFTDAKLEELEGLLLNFSDLKLALNDAQEEHFRYIINIDSAKDNFEATSSLANALQENGFKIFGMKSIVRDLESIFADITSGKSIDDSSSASDNPKINT